MQFVILSSVVVVWSLALVSRAVDQVKDRERDIDRIKSWCICRSSFPITREKLKESSWVKRTEKVESNKRLKDVAKGDMVLPSGSNIRGMSKYFSATSKAVFKFSKGLSLDNLA